MIISLISITCSFWVICLRVITFCCFCFRVEKEGVEVYSINRNKTLIKNKIRNREKDRIRGFDRTIRIQIGEGFEGFVGCFFRYYKVISYINILVAIRLNLRIRLDRFSLKGTSYNLFNFSFYTCSSVLGPFVFPPIALAWPRFPVCLFCLLTFFLAISIRLVFWASIIIIFTS
jgi:hypothetical protein